MADTSGGLAIDHEIVEKLPASLGIDARAPRTVRLIDMAPPARVEGRLLIWTARARPLLREGRAWLESWVTLPGGEGYSARSPAPVSRTRDWVDLTAQIRVEKGVKPDRLRLNLVLDGAGKFWIESLKLESAPLPRQTPEEAAAGKETKP